MPKKTTKKTAPKTQKVDLSGIEFFLALNFFFTVVFGVITTVNTHDLSDRLKGVRDEIFDLDLRTISVAHNAEKAREYALSAKVYSRELYEQSQKKSAAKK